MNRFCRKDFKICTKLKIVKAILRFIKFKIVFTTQQMLIIEHKTHKKSPSLKIPFSKSCWHFLVLYTFLGPKLRIVRQGHMKQFNRWKGWEVLSGRSFAWHAQVTLVPSNLTTFIPPTHSPRENAVLRNFKRLGR